MDSVQLKDRLKNISKEKEVDFNTLLRLFMYERFLERLALSKYKDNFILKGGFYLSSFFGVENRSTMDIDAAFHNANFTEENLVQMIEEIISIDIKDNSKIKYLGIDPIRDEDQYGGYRIDLQIEYENIKERFHLDVATGDPITPKEITYSYKPILKSSEIKLWAYNMETILAEKLETLLSRLELNSRMRDYYDIYLIYTKDWENINKTHLKKAISKTFSKRNFQGDTNQSLKIIKESMVLRNRWNLYAKKNKYSEHISFEEIIKVLYTIMSSI